MKEMKNIPASVHARLQNKAKTRKNCFGKYCSIMVWKNSSFAFLKHNMGVCLL